MADQGNNPYRDLDLWPLADVASAIVSSQARAVEVVEAAGPALARAAEALAGRMARGGRMAYAGAGSSGVLAQLDALEMPGTYGIPADRVPVILAGGPDSLQALNGGAEDDAAAGAAAVDALALGPDDGLIAVAASGSTPFTLGALERAAARGAVTVALACRTGAPLLAASHHPIALPTPPEVVSGSTRMAAGTAQKVALNILSTAVAVQLGHVFHGHMVNMTVDNAKLRARAVSVVMEATGAEPAVAVAALEGAGWALKPAILACATGQTPDQARAALARAGGRLRIAGLNPRP